MKGRFFAARVLKRALQRPDEKADKSLANASACIRIGIYTYVDFY